MADELNFQLPEKGFDSYLAGIIPEDQAVLAGAFSVAMQQIRNIERVPAPEFARVVFNSETTIGLPLTNGTDVPTNLPLQSEVITKEALGSGVNGTYTMSNFFGAMSGLPYPWKLLTQSIKNLTTQKLTNIYQEMFLGVTWEYAEVRITQPYWSTTSRGFEGSIAQPYVPPTVSANTANPNYQPNPDITDPPYDPYPYLNGSSGAPTYSPSYYSAGGQPAIWDWYYKIGSLTLTEDGGGYGRGTAPNPSVYIVVRTGRSGRSVPDTSINVPCTGGLDGYCSPTGATARAPVGRDPQNCASVGRKTYGRVSLAPNLGSPYAWRTGDSQATINWVDLAGQDTLDNPPRTPILYEGYPGQSTNPRDNTFVAANIPRETVEIQDPPIEMLPVQASGAKAINGVNTNGRVFADPFMFGSLGNLNPWEPGAPGLQAYGTIFWPDPGNAVVQGYIDQANTEIQSIRTRNPQNFEASTQLNGLWDITAIALKHEQRARYIATAPVPIPWESRYADIPTALNTFVDSIPEYALQTAPHMAVQTLEHISNTDTVGGQSIIAMMRQERNQSRLAEVGIQLDNNMPTKLTPQQEQRLMLNGTLPGAVEGVPSGILPGTDGDGNVIYTIPSWPENTKPITYWDCAENQLKQITNLKNGTIIPILNGEGCPIVNPEVPAGPGPGLGPNPNIFENDNDSGSNPNGTFPPANVNSNFTGTTLQPSTYDPGEAIEKVIECNCDCWIE